MDTFNKRKNTLPLSILLKNLRRKSLSVVKDLSWIVDGDDKIALERAKLDIEKKEFALRDIEDVLPRSPGTLDAVFHFLLVWYYCTLTIRERILIANGSRIKGWWNISHFLLTVCAGIMLIWPRSQSYDEFHDQFMLYSVYLNLIHCIQYQYQIGCLYKLRTLGCRHSMDITIDGFMSWMFKQLSFILPFLFSVYIVQLYHAFTLYAIYQKDYCNEWQASILLSRCLFRSKMMILLTVFLNDTSQVLIVGIIFFVLAMGSIITICHVIYQKLRGPPPGVLRSNLLKKYSFARHKRLGLVDDKIQTDGDSMMEPSEDDDCPNEDHR